MKNSEKTQGIPDYPAIISLLIVMLLFTSPVDTFSQEGTLQFSSGFEPDTRLVIWSNTITGIDHSSEPGINDWDKIPERIDWVVKLARLLQGGNIEIVADPLDTLNNVLLLHNTELDENQNHSRSQLVLLQAQGWTDPGGPNLFKQQFYRYRMFIPGEIKKTVAFDTHSPWYMIWESHAWVSDETRHGVYIFKNRNSNLWYFQARQQHPEKVTIWESTATIEVPFDRWFTFDVFFKYHETDGEFYLGITDGDIRHEVIRFKGLTKNGTKLRDQMVFKSYHSSHYTTKLKELGYSGTRIYYDDFQIWSDYPPGYWDAASGNQNISAKVNDLDDIQLLNNPYHGSGDITFTNLPEEVNLTIYSIRGTIIKRLSIYSTDGIYSWNGLTDKGEHAGQGVFIAKLSKGNDQKVFKIMILK